MAKTMTIELFQPVYQISWNDYRSLLKGTDPRKEQVHAAVLSGLISVI